MSTRSGQRTSPSDLECRFRTEMNLYSSGQRTSPSDLESAGRTVY